MELRQKNNKPPFSGKTPVERIRTLILVGTLTICVTLAVGGVSSGQLLEFGRSLAMLSVSIMQPEGGVQALSGRLDRLPANQKVKDGNERADGTSYDTGGADQSVDTNSSHASGEVPAEAGDGGKVIEQQITTESAQIQGVSIKNASSASIDVAAELAKKPDIDIVKTKEPQVLILHTHTTEAYMTYFAGYYNASDPNRTSDTSRSVVAVGEAIAQQLRASGIGVIHETTVFDSPYTGAYDRAAEVISKLLKQYPTIKVVLDIHRDAINRSTSEKLKPTAVIDGKKAAQMMIITSVCNSKTAPHPDWEQNLRFALRLHSTLNTQYEGIMRPMYLVDSRYNEHLTHGSLLIEVGSEANTIDEATYSGELLGKGLSKVLSEL